MEQGINCTLLRSLRFHLLVTRGCRPCCAIYLLFAMSLLCTRSVYMSRNNRVSFGKGCFRFGNDDV